MLFVMQMNPFDLIHVSTFDICSPPCLRSLNPAACLRSCSIKYLICSFNTMIALNPGFIYVSDWIQNCSHMHIHSLHSGYQCAPLLIVPWVHHMGDVERYTAVIRDPS